MCSADIVEKILDENSAKAKQLTNSKNMMNEIFAFIDGNTILRTMVGLNRRIREEILTQLGPM